MERIEMSKKEIGRLEVIRQVLDEVMSQRRAAELLGLCERQVRRLQRGYEEEGAVALVSKKRGRASNRRIDDEVRTAIVARVRTRYHGFGPTLAAEYLGQDGYRVSKETQRRWMVGAGLWQVTKGRRRALHPPRLRRSRVGELIQIDGSPHDWFEGRGPRCTLIAFIDDATSQIMAAGFVPVESSQAYLDALFAYVSAYGCPAALYSDRHGIFRKHDPEDDTPTQFQRALGALGIEGIQALTPQAKGRVERVFQTLQDRLVKAMRLFGIDDMAGANASCRRICWGTTRALPLRRRRPTQRIRPTRAAPSSFPEFALCTIPGRSAKNWCCRSTGSATSCRPAARLATHYAARM